MKNKALGRFFLMQLLMASTYVPSLSKQIMRVINCLQTILNLNFDFHLKIIFNFS